MQHAIFIAYFSALNSYNRYLNIFIMSFWSFQSFFFFFIYIFNFTTYCLSTHAVITTWITTTNSWTRRSRKSTNQLTNKYFSKGPTRKIWLHFDGFVPRRHKFCSIRFCHRSTRDVVRSPRSYMCVNIYKFVYTYICKCVRVIANK